MTDIHEYEKIRAAPERHGGALLRAWRESQGLGLRGLADRISDSMGETVPHVKLHRIEVGKSPPSIALMAAIHAVTNGAVRPDHFVFGGR